VRGVRVEGMRVEGVRVKGIRVEGVRVEGMRVERARWGDKIAIRTQTQSLILDTVVKILRVDQYGRP
jgi:hypothetical protein